MDIDLKEKQIIQLIKLEELFHSHYLTEELLNEMISLYVKFVENIPSNQHPLRLFFMEKIRLVLSRPEVIKILEKETTAQNRSIRDTVRGMIGVNEEDEIEIKRMAEEAKAEVRQNHLINTKKAGNTSDEHLKEKERNLKIELQMKIMEEVESNMNKFRKDLSNGKQKHVEKENQINKLVNQQDQNLNERRANRKKRLRKKSDDLTDKEVVADVAPIPIKQLKLVQQELNQTYERFTRLTQNKLLRMGTNEKKQNEGRVKIQVKQYSYNEEELFEDLGPKAKKEEVPNFSKKKSQASTQNTLKPPTVPQEKSSSSKSLQYKQGRVTVRNTKYQATEEEQLI